MTKLGDLPDELIEHILVDSDPVEVSKLAQTCKDLHSIIYEAPDQSLWRRLYLRQDLDDPRTCVTLTGGSAVHELLSGSGSETKKPGLCGGTGALTLNWKMLLQDVIYFRSFVRRGGAGGGLVGIKNLSVGDRLRAWETMRKLISYTPEYTRGPRSDSILEHTDITVSRSLEWVSKLLVAHPQCLQDGSWVVTEAERQVYSQVHVFYGPTLGECLVGERLVECRAKVYDMRMYRDDNHYGAYLPGSDKPNWDLVLAIQHVLALQVVEHGPDSNLLDGDDSDDEDDEENGSGRWYLRESLEGFPLGLMNTQIFSARQGLYVFPDTDGDRGAGLSSSGQSSTRRENRLKDWADVEGKYIVSFCFCDHHVLIAYNDSAQYNPSSTLDATIFADPSFVEIYRSLTVDLQVTKVEEDGTDTPRIHFSGGMGLPRHSTVTGEVSVTSDGHVRWHFDCGEMGAAIWSCEGIQIGGIASKYGALGVWTTIYHSDDDPIGPFWLRKVAD